MPHFELPRLASFFYQLARMDRADPNYQPIKVLHTRYLVANLARRISGLLRRRMGVTHRKGQETMWCL